MRVLEEVPHHFGGCSNQFEDACPVVQHGLAAGRDLYDYLVVSGIFQMAQAITQFCCRATCRHPLDQFGRRKPVLVRPDKHQVAFMQAHVSCIARRKTFIEFVRWPRLVGQFGGWDKLGSGYCQAANLSISVAPYASFGVRPARVE
jgi:hypothetical protein